MRSAATWNPARSGASRLGVRAIARARPLPLDVLVEARRQGLDMRHQVGAQVAIVLAEDGPDPQAGEQDQRHHRGEHGGGDIIERPGPLGGSGRLQAGCAGSLHPAIPHGRSRSSAAGPLSLSATGPLSGRDSSTCPTRGSRRAAGRRTPGRTPESRDRSGGLRLIPAFLVDGPPSTSAPARRPAQAPCRRSSCASGPVSTPAPCRPRPRRCAARPPGGLRRQVLEVGRAAHLRDEAPGDVVCLPNGRPSRRTSQSARSVAVEKPAFATAAMRSGTASRSPTMPAAAASTISRVSAASKSCSLSSCMSFE